MRTVIHVKVLGEVDGEPAMVDSDERLVTKGLKSQWIAQTKESANKALARDGLVCDSGKQSEMLPFPQRSLQSVRRLLMLVPQKKRRLLRQRRLRA
jgi:hypothetical protein